jgi:hypothetical protein
MSILPPSWCAQETELFYGVSQTDEQAKLWADFLATDAAAPYIDPETKNIPEPAASSPEVQALYLKFLQGKLSAVYVSESANALSPKEVQARFTMLQAFAIVLAMLKALQNCMKEQSQLLGFYTNWQKEYTKMMTATPIYGPVDNAKIIVKTTDFGNTTLGYGKISINQIVDYLLSKLPPSGNAGTVLWRSPPNDHGVRWYFHLTKAADGTYSFSADIRGHTWISDTESWCGKNQVFGYAIGSSAPDSTLSDAEAKKAVIQNISDALTSYVQNQISAHPTDYFFVGYGGDDGPTWADVAQWGTQAANMYNIGIIGPAIGPGADMAHGELRFGAGAWDEQFRGPYSESSSDDKKNAQSKRQASQSYRGDINSQLGQYTEAARANRTQVANMASLTQSVMDQTKDSLSAQKDLLTAITESLRTLLTAIFR